MSTRLVQFYSPEAGGRRLGAIRNGQVFDLTAVDGAYDSFMSLLRLAGGKAEDMAEIALAALELAPEEKGLGCDSLDRPPHPQKAHLLMPISPPEVWGFGVTYKRSAEARDADVAKTLDSSASIYDRVYHSQRPECFFKATAPRCVGPHQPICIRSDSELTATEPELAYILGVDYEVVGYTICNDVSAWDLERENPLYLPQSKIFRGCCALGPAIALAAGGPDPYDLEISCRIIRDCQVIYSDSTSSGNIGRPFEELNEYLYRDNPIPLGTVVSSGTGIMIPNEYALQNKDFVEVAIEGIGILKNPVEKLGKLKYSG